MGLRLLFFAFAVGGVLQAQTGTLDLKASAGIASFVDEDAENHFQTGIAARIYLTRRFSIEPEFLYLYQSSSHHDLILVPNVAWDFGGSRIVPYVSGGIGLMRSTFGNFGRGSFNSNEGFVQVGGGAKIYVHGNWFLAPEARIGWEPHLRFSVAFGYTRRP